MSTMKWEFQLDENGVVQLAAGFVSDDQVIHDMHEEVKPGGNFCGVKYAALRAAERGVLDVSWSQFAKWRAR